MRSIIVPKWVKKHLALNSGYWNVDQFVKLEIFRSLKRYRSENGVVVTVVIPAWNEEESILTTLSSLAEQEMPFPCELIVVNNNSTDRTQLILDEMGVKSILESRQGVGYARQSGLEAAKGKYFLCADADCIYPPKWIKTMVETIQKNESKGAVAVYSDYSFIPTAGTPRCVMAIYELVRNIIYYLKLRKKVHLLVRGFSFGFISSEGLKNGAFLLGKQRVGKGILGSDDYAIGGEDGNMAYTLINSGGKVLKAPGYATVWTSDRRLVYDGGFLKSLTIRIKKYLL